VNIWSIFEDRHKSQETKVGLESPAISSWGANCYHQYPLLTALSEKETRRTEGSSQATTERERLIRFRFRFETHDKSQTWERV